MTKKTFTLLELVIVLLIIGALATLAIEQYMDSQVLTKMRIFEENVNEITKTLSVYKSKSNSILYGNQTNSYPISLVDSQFKALFKQEPRNPYTSKPMLTDNSVDSGIQYVSDGTSYKLCITQRDVDDVNNNGFVEEVLPLSNKTACIGNTQTSVRVAFTRNSVAYTSNGMQVAVDVPRYETGKFGQAIMIEEGTRNIFTNPRLLNNGSGWTPNSSTVWVDSSGEYPYIHCEQQWDGVYQTLYLSNTTYTLTYLVKHKAGSNTIGSHFDGSPSMKIRVDSGAWVDGNIITVPSDGNWHLVEIQATYTTAGSRNVYLQPGRGVTGVSEFYFKYAQIEQKPYATSFIDVDRAAETLTIPTAGVLNPQEGTVEFMVNLNTLSPSFYNAFFTSGDVYAPGPRILIMREFEGGDVNNVNKIQVWDGDGSSEAILTSVTTLQAGIWYYVAFTWSPSGRKLYVNGVLEASNTRSNNLGFATLAKIGSWLSIGYGYLDGLIDDLRISNRARSDAEIQAAYRNNQPLPVDAWTTLKLDFNGDLSTQSGVIP